MSPRELGCPNDGNENAPLWRISQHRRRIYVNVSPNSVQNELITIASFLNALFPVPDLENLTERSTLNIFDHIKDVKMTKTVLAITEYEMYLADTIRLPYSIELSNLCHLSKNLYNTGHYYSRDYFFYLIKKDYKPKIDYGGTGKLGYYKLWNIVKNSKEYKALPPQSAQQVLRLLEQDWLSYYENIKKWRAERAKNSKNCREKPKIPKYKKKDGETIVIFTNQQCKIMDRWLIFPKKGRNKEDTRWLPSVKTRFNSLGKLHLVMIVPRVSCYDIVIVYSVQKRDLDLDRNRAVALDLGVENLLAIADNFGNRPMLVKGGVVKSINQEYNKLIQQSQMLENLKKKCIREHGRTPKWAELKRMLPEYKTERKLIKTFKSRYYREHGYFPIWEQLTELLDKNITREKESNKQEWTMQMYRILVKRNNKIRNFFHKVSKSLIDYCVANNIGTIFIGHNAGWKQSINLGKKTNQKFVQIPFNKLIQQIQYKAELVGIQVRIITESHTSKCSALDSESIEHHDEYLGWRLHRGIFKSADGKCINADVNAAYNILKRGCETLDIPFNLSVEQMLWSPKPILLNVNPIA